MVHGTTILITAVPLTAATAIGAAAAIRSDFGLCGGSGGLFNPFPFFPFTLLAAVRRLDFGEFCRVRARRYPLRGAQRTAPTCGNIAKQINLAPLKKDFDPILVSQKAKEVIKKPRRKPAIVE